MIYFVWLQVIVNLVLCLLLIRQIRRLKQSTRDLCAAQLQCESLIEATYNITHDEFNEIVDSYRMVLEWRRRQEAGE